MIFFAACIERHKALGDALRPLGYWRARQNVGRLTVALLQPSGLSEEWVEIMQRLLRRVRRDPTDASLARSILRPSGSCWRTSSIFWFKTSGRGEPRESFPGYIHALAIPQIRLCRVDSEEEERILGRFLEPVVSKDRRLLLPSKIPPGPPALASIPRLLDNTKLDKAMQPVIFWTMAKYAADQILETMRRISIFRSGLSPARRRNRGDDRHSSERKAIFRSALPSRRARLRLS